jgi:hypothetical protein
MFPTMSTTAAQLAALLLGALLVAASPARARTPTLRGEGWAGAGFHDPDYRTGATALGRVGLGLRVLERVSLGADGQWDRNHWFAFGYAGLTLPSVSFAEPYARFHVGKRDDLDETAYSWSAGFRLREGPIGVFIEAHGVIQPGESIGASMGVSF